MDVSVINIRVRLNIFKPSSQLVIQVESECLFIDVIDEMIEKALPIILSNDHLGTYLFHGSLSLFDLGGK